MYTSMGAFALTIKRLGLLHNDNLRRCLNGTDVMKAVTPIQGVIEEGDE